jgi:hypothetical protein
MTISGDIRERKSGSGMKAYQLADQPGSSTTLPGLAQLIDVVGDDAFASSLFKSVFSLTRSDHLTAFSFAGNTEPRYRCRKHRPPSCRS